MMVQGWCWQWCDGDVGGGMRELVVLMMVVVRTVFVDVVKMVLLMAIAV